MAVSPSSGLGDRRKWIQLVGLQCRGREKFFDFVEHGYGRDAVEEVLGRDDVCHMGGEDVAFIVKVLLEVGAEFGISTLCPTSSHSSSTDV